MIGERIYRSVGLAAAMLVVGSLSSRLAPPPMSAYAAPALSGTPTEQLGRAADALAAAITGDGTGVSFEVVQRNTLHARPGGPLIELRDPQDRTRVLATVDQHSVNSIVTRGAVTPTAFWMLMRRGPAEGEPADFDHSLALANVIERDGVIWRDDGLGWYVTDVSPGMGMDPVSARLLPELLRRLVAVEQLQATVFDGRFLVGAHGSASPDLYPGVLASDGRESTGEQISVECWLDDSGRLIRLVTQARNTNETTFDLIGETVITFTYDPPGAPPEPNPTMAPEPLPTNAPGDIEVGS